MSVSTINTYSELQTAVANWMARSDLTSRIQEFIGMGEVKMNRDLRVREMITTTNITPSQVNKYVSLPTGFMELISFSDDYGQPIQEVDYDELEKMSYSTSSARPEYCAIGARIDFERTADSSLSFPMRYYQRLDLPTDGSNDVLTNYPDIYLYASLMFAEPFRMNEQRLPIWATLYEDAVDEANYRSTKNNKRLRTELNGVGFDIIRGF